MVTNRSNAAELYTAKTKKFGNVYLKMNVKIIDNLVEILLNTFICPRAHVTLKN